MKNKHIRDILQSSVILALALASCIYFILFVGTSLNNRQSHMENIEDNNTIGEQVYLNRYAQYGTILVSYEPNENAMYLHNFNLKHAFFLRWLPGYYSLCDTVKISLDDLEDVTYFPHQNQSISASSYITCNEYRKTFEDGSRIYMLEVFSPYMEHGSSQNRYIKIAVGHQAVPLEIEESATLREVGDKLIYCTVQNESGIEILFQKDRATGVILSS